MSQNSGTILSKAGRSNYAVWMLTILSLSISAVTQAEIYKCENGGKVSYQQHPCASTGKATKMAAGSASPNLWVNLKSGMSIADVQRMVPQAKAGSYSSLHNGARGLLQVSPINVVGKKFDANFFFLDDQYYRVNFSGPLNDSNESNLQSFNQLFSIFQARYGTPSSRQVSDKTSGLSARAEWQLPTGEVWMIISPITAKTSLMNFG